MEAIEYASIAIGWIYFFAWSISFYPQVIYNFRQKNVIGLSFDFLALNITGHSCYLAFTISTYSSGNVEINDIAFAVHAVLLTAINILQCFLYERGQQRVTPLVRIIVALVWTILIVSFSLVALGYVDVFTAANVAGGIKLFMSFIKYTPQAWMNYKRKSTVGWSIGNVLLDFTGGTLSFLQQFLDSVHKDDWSKFTGNIPKTGLALESIAFDLLFIFQHYVLYRTSVLGYEPIAPDKRNGSRIEHV